MASTWITVSKTQFPGHTGRNGNLGEIPQVELRKVDAALPRYLKVCLVGRRGGGGRIDAPAPKAVTPDLMAHGLI